MNGIESRQLKIALCGLAALGMFAATQGCSSSGGGGTGGAGGAGTGSGGRGGGAGTTAGAGGTTVDAGPPLCTGGALTGAPLISDFSDVTAADGSTTLIIPGKGGVSPYGGTVATIANGAVAVTGTITAGTYAGVSIYFDSCIDATSYTGVKFKLTGTFGTCDMLKLGANFPQVETMPPAAHGACVPPAAPAPNNCYGPGFAYTAATTMVAFADMNGGGAVATVTPDAKNRLTGIGFGFHGPATGADGGTGGCTVNFTIDDVSFY
jgi:hypothetical protein